MWELLDLVLFWIELGAPERPDASMLRKVLFLFAPALVLLGMAIAALFSIIAKAKGST